MKEVERIVAAVRSVVKERAPLHAPEIVGNEWAYVKECLDTEWVSTAGSYVNRFEDMLCGIIGTKHAIAVSSGTAGLHAALTTSGVGRGDEVIIPSLTFVATANAVAQAGAVPHFVDSEQHTFGIDPVKLDQHLTNYDKDSSGKLVNSKTGRSIKALICVHVFGHPAQLDALAEVCRRYGIILIEDATESLGSYYHGRHTGNDGLVSVFSFNGNKIVTTGGGGAIVTSNDRIAERARHLTTNAKIAHRWEFIHDGIGYNYRMPNLNAALGCGQLEKLNSFVARKRLLAQNYRQAFDSLSSAEFISEPPECLSNYWLNTIRLNSESDSFRDLLLQELNDAGFMSRPLWRPIHLLDVYKDAPRADLRMTELLYNQLVCLPSSPRLAD
jgi:perosamine synthetase